MPRRQQRGGRSPLKPRASHLAMALLIGLLGFAITVQLNQKDEEDFSNVRGADLVELLKSLDAANERLSGQIQDLTNTRDELLSSTRRSEEAKKQAAKRSEQLEILGGSVAAEGPGIEMIIDDPDRKIDAAVLLDAVEELRDAGAEAIVINDSARVVAQTYFLDADNAIRVGGREVQPPFKIEAIGEPETLAGAMIIREGVFDRVESRGGTATIDLRSKITITALADVKAPEYARSE